jgi:HEAT repeat protein
VSQSGPETAEIELLIDQLDSVLEGPRAIEMLIARGQWAVPYLEGFLLAGPPRTIALPRCRVVHALGELGAYSALTSYFRKYAPPADAQVLFAEDAVRSAAATELLHWKSEEVFRVLLDAAKQRATSGLIFALGEFRNAESIPLLFTVLEDDLCREEAKAALRKVADAAHQYAILLARGSTYTRFRGPYALRRRRATLQLLEEFGVSAEEWKDLREFLFEEDSDVVIAAAGVGLTAGKREERSQIVQELFRIASRVNWAQEDQVFRLMDANSPLAISVARTIAGERVNLGEHPNLLNPLWRLLQHLLGSEFERGHYGAA